MAAHIGLIGGIGPAATDYYYRRIIAPYAESDLDLELTIIHAHASMIEVEKPVVTARVFPVDYEHLLALQLNKVLGRRRLT